MSIYDRDYARDDANPDPWAAWRWRFSAVWALLLLNVAVFLGWIFTGGPRASLFMRENFTLSWEGLAEYRFHTLLTAAFSQFDTNHILFNKIGLWVFGEIVEARYGARGVIYAYLISALAASVAHVGLCLARGVYIPMLGSSGAVMGLMAVAALTEPNATMLLFFVIPLKLKWLAVLYVVLDLSGVMGVQADRVAHAAHLGGMLSGFLLWRFGSQWLGAMAWGGEGFRARLGRLFRRRPKLKVVERPAPGDELGEPPPGVDARTASRVDQILAKIHRDGLGALTEEEKEFLKEASTKYRR
jgi:membrane associated rhomboid family serine protease